MAQVKFVEEMGKKSVGEVSGFLHDASLSE